MSDQPIIVGTNWTLTLSQPEGTPIAFALNFRPDGKCRYSIHQNCTYTATDTAFVVIVPVENGGPQVHELQLKATYLNGSGDGILTHIPLKGWHPDGDVYSFTLKED